MNNLSNLDINTLKEHNIPITEELLTKLNDGYPLQFIVGDAIFYGYKYFVNENVLIPRFETEQLIEKIINKNIKFNKVLDLCSGSGAIGLTIANLTNASVDMVELSHEANEVCMNNIKYHDLEEKVNLIETDLFKYNINDDYDLIISNPPYLTHQDNVSSNTRFEPDMALYSDDDPIKYYKYIIDQVTKLNNYKLVAFEIGEEEANDIILYANSKKINNIYVEKDYNDKDRFIFIEK